MPPSPADNLVKPCGLVGRTRPHFGGDALSGKPVGRTGCRSQPGRLVRLPAANFRILP